MEPRVNIDSSCQTLRGPYGVFTTRRSVDLMVSSQPDAPWTLWCLHNHTLRGPYGVFTTRRSVDLMVSSQPDAPWTLWCLHNQTLRGPYGVFTTKPKT
ncbi:hypothetical protein BaRGS_00031013 [Batillaria attramentaria]|uniref:Uncharacterized protein n=1 Tax=Batillaria attramentaria TaxID=370345 RepID=A0ABD0JRP5_9CAEN